MGEITEDVLKGLQAVGAELVNRKTFGDPNYMDDLVYVVECAGHAQSALGRLARVMATPGMCFAPSKCRALLQDWKTVAPNLILDGEERTIVDRFR